MTARRGFALPVVIWTLAAVSAVSAGALAAASSFQRAGRNRIILAQAHWLAEACVATGMSILDSIAGHGDFVVPASLEWSGTRGGCTVRFEDTGSRVLADSAPEDLLLRLAVEAAARGIPVESLMTTAGTGRINLNTATETVLRSLPGLSAGVVDQLLRRRAYGQRLTSLTQLAGLAWGRETDSLTSQTPALERLTTFSVAAVAMTATGIPSGTSLRASVQLIVRRTGNRVAVVQRRLW